MIISVSFRAWLRNLIGNSFIANIRFIKRYIGVGQGPHEFIYQLLIQDDRTISIVPRPLKAEASLFLISATNKQTKLLKKNNTPVIVRLDGIGIDSENLSISQQYSMQNAMNETLSNADAIIFQSEFSKESFYKVYEIPNCMVTVIHNGAFQRNHKSTNKEIKQFVVGGRDAPRKRIAQTIKCFINSSYSEKYILNVVGNFKYDDMVHKNVVYHGKLNRDQLQNIICLSSGLLHLDWYDWCPNLVVEAIGLGTPVLCGSVGGTKEIVKHSGIIADLNDPVPNFSKEKNNTIPIIKQHDFDINFNEFLTYCNDMNCDRDDLDIKFVAQKYWSFISEVLLHCGKSKN
jgi:glycosyltransferase involved in cell wall biosynthesis